MQTQLKHKYVEILLHMVGELLDNNWVETSNYQKGDLRDIWIMLNRARVSLAHKLGEEEQEKLDAMVRDIVDEELDNYAEQRTAQILHWD